LTSYSDELVGIAYLGRFNPGPCAVFIRTLMTERMGQIQAQIGQQNRVDDFLKEQMHWLLLISGFLLTDDPSTERITVPTLINAFSIHCAQNKIDDPICGMLAVINQVVEFENLCIQNKRTQLWSSTLGSTVVWYLNRWCQTYLFVIPESQLKNISPNLLAISGRNDVNGINTHIDMLLQKVALNLLLWDPEGRDEELANKTCALLNGMSKLKIQTSHIIPLKAWQLLFQAHVTSEKLIADLEPKVQRKFVEGMLCLHSSEDLQCNFEYFQQVVHPLKEKYRSMTSPEFAQNCNSPVAIKIVINTLELTIGVVTATNAKNFGYVWGFIAEIIPFIIQFFMIYKRHDVASLVLGLWCSMSRDLLSRLPLEEQFKFFQASANLFNEFRKAGYGKKNTRRKRPESEDEEQYQNIKKVLRISSEISTQEHKEAARFAHLGLSIVMPALTKDMFQFPKLGHLYYEILLQLCRRHPQFFPILPDDMFKTTINSFRFILFETQFEPSVITNGLHALLNLFSYALEQRQEGKEVFALHPWQKPTLVVIQTMALDFMLFGTDIFHPLIMDIAPDVFFAIICFDQGTFNQYVTDVIKRQQPQIQQPVTVAFTQLISGLSTTFTGPNKAQFRKNLKAFLTNGRSFLRKTTDN